MAANKLIIDDSEESYFDDCHYYDANNIRNNRPKSIG